MHSTHHEKVIMGVSASSLNSINALVLGFQFILMLVLMFSDKMKTYTLYFVLDLMMLIPLFHCFCVFFKYMNEDRPIRRTCLPIACCIMIVITGAFLFQCVCMTLKQKGKFDISDKNSALPSPSANKTKTKHSGSDTNSKNSNKSDKSKESDYAKFSEKAGNDVVDESTAFESFGFYIFCELVFVVYWCVSYLCLNSYVQKNLP